MVYTRASILNIIFILHNVYSMNKFLNAKISKTHTQKYICTYIHAQYQGIYIYYLLYYVFSIKNTHALFVYSILIFILFNINYNNYYNNII